MTELIVLAFPNPQGAFEVRDRLIALQSQHLIRLEDAAVAVREPDGRVRIKQIVDLTAEGALGGAFWGLLAGILFWLPLLGMAIGTLMGAISGSLADYGVNDDFIHEVSQTIQPGHSALFLLIRQATLDRVAEEIRPWQPTVLRTNLSREQEEKLRAAFGEGPLQAEVTK